MNRSPAPHVDPATYRRLLGSFTTGVTVVTVADAEGAPAGMTASAVSSVSLDPPLLLICIDHAATIHDLLARASRFAINVLASDQETLSRKFAGDADERFAGVGYATDATGLPLLDEVVAHIICETERAVAVGDHTVLFGRVIGGEAFERAPLLHFRGGYRSPDLAP